MTKNPPVDEATLKAFGDIVRYFAPLDTLALYRCRVLSQNADGTYEIKPEDPRVPPVSRVPARPGSPGEKVKLSAGGRALVGFEDGDEARPYLTSWQEGQVEERELLATKLLKLRSAVVEVGEGAKRAIAGVGDFAKLGGGPLPVQCLITLGAPGAVGPAPQGAPLPATLVFPKPVMLPIVSGSSSGKVR